MNRDVRLVYVLLFGLLISPGVLSAADKPAGPPPAAVKVAPVQTKQVRQHQLVMGQVEPARRSLVSSEERGRVIQAPPEPGVAVTEGQVIARLDDTLLKIEHAAAAARLREAEAALADKQAYLTLAQRDRQRIEELFASKVARDKELADARDKETAASSQVQLAQAQLARAQADLSHLDARIRKMTVASPFNGFVVRKATEVGQWMEPGAAVAELVETHRVKVRLDVPQAVLASVNAEEPIAIQFEALDKTIEQKLFSIVPDADPQSRTFRLLIKLDNADGSLKPGMTVSAMLPTSQTMEALTIPRDAVQRTAAGTIVYVNRGGVAAAVPVSIRFGEGDRFVVDASLRDGEQVVVEGNERLFPGQPLNVVGQPAVPGPSTAPAGSAAK